MAHETALVDGRIDSSGLCFLFEQLAKQFELNCSHEFTDGAVFIDIGSSHGEALLFVACHWNRLQVAVGVEIVEERHARAAALYESLLAEGNKDHLLGDGRVRLMCADMFEVPWGDFVPQSRHHPQRYILLLNSLCFDNAMQIKILQKVESEVNSDDELIILTTKIIEDISCHFHRDVLVWYEAPVKVSWSACGVVFQVIMVPPKSKASNLEVLQMGLGDKLSRVAAEELVRKAPLPPLWHGSCDDSLGALKARRSCKEAISSSNRSRSK